MEVELRFFATFRQDAGQKVVRMDVDGATTAGDVLRAVKEEYPAMELFQDDGTLREYVRVMKNGEQIVHQDGLETDVADGDTLSVFPPVAGG